MKCWGGNQRGELGQGDTSARGDQPGEFVTGVPPISLSRPGRKATQVSAEGDVSCAVLDTERVACWGADNRRVNGGIGDAPDEMGTNLQRRALTTSVSPAAVSGDGECVLMQRGTVECAPDGTSDSYPGHPAGLTTSGPGGTIEGWPLRDVGR